MKKKSIELHLVNGAFWWAPVARQKKKKYPSAGTCRPQSYRRMTLITKDKKRLCRMLRRCAQVPEGEAKVFMSLTFDYNVKKWTLKACRKRVELFNRYLKRQFPRCWFIYIWEYSIKTGYHVHFWGRFHKAEAKSKVVRKWLKLTSSRDQSMICIRKARQFDVGYMAKPGKRKGRLKLLQQLGRKSSWGIVNRAMLPQFQPRKFLFYADDWAHFIVAAVYHADLDPEISPSFTNKLFNKTGALYLGFTPEILKKVLRYVKMCRRTRQ